MWRIRAPLLALLLMQVVLLASAGATAVKKPLGKQDTCNMKNHMIEYLRNNGVQIYERPQISSVTCGSEWATFGTCCETNTLGRSLQAKIKANKQALYRVTSELHSLHPTLRGFRLAQIDPLIKARKTPVVRLGNGLTFATSANQTFNWTLAHKMVAENDRLLIELHKQVAKAVKNQERCVQTLNQVISKSACSICSGRSDDFFNKDGRLAVSESTCRTVLGGCAAAWVSLLAIKQVAEQIILNIRQLGMYLGHEVSQSLLDQITFTMNLDSFITNRNLIPIMRNCGENEKHLAECSFEHVAALCEQFIHIQAPTYIESSQNLLQDSVQKALKIQVETGQWFKSLQKCDHNLRQLLAPPSLNAIQLLNIRDELDRCNGLLKVLETFWLDLQESLVIFNKARAESGVVTETTVAKYNSLMKTADDLVGISGTSLWTFHQVLVQALLKSQTASSPQLVTRRLQIKELWADINSVMQFMRNPDWLQDPNLAPGIRPKQYLRTPMDCRREALRGRFRAQILQKIFDQHMPKERDTALAVLSALRNHSLPLPNRLTTNVSRKLALSLTSKKKAGLHDYTTETVVVRDCRNCFDLAAQKTELLLLTRPNR